MTRRPQTPGKAQGAWHVLWRFECSTVVVFSLTNVVILFCLSLVCPSRRVYTINSTQTTGRTILTSGQRSKWFDVGNENA